MLCGPIERMDARRGVDGGPRGGCPTEARGRFLAATALEARHASSMGCNGDSRSTKGGM